MQMAYSPEKFGPNVKAARGRLRLTQEQAATRAGVATRTFVKWEHGDAMPHGYNLENLAKALRVDPVDLLEGVNDSEPERTVHEKLDGLEAKLDTVLELFTDAEALAAAIDQRRALAATADASAAAGAAVRGRKRQHSA